MENKIMYQTEFEQGIKDIRSKYQPIIKGLELQQKELKHELSGLVKQASDLRQKLQRVGIMRIEMESKQRDEVAKFTKENFTIKRNMEDVSDWALVNEMKKRGYYGDLHNEEKDADWLAGIAAKFADRYVTPPNVAELVEQQLDEENVAHV